SVTLSPTSGTVSETTVYARVTSAATGALTGNITAASSGATTRNVAVNGFAAGASFSATGTTFTVNLGCSAKVSVASAGTSYTFTLTSGSWIGSATGASASGTVLTVSAAGLSAYDNFEILDGAAGAQVVFANSGVNVYSDNFAVCWDQQFECYY
ncbi:MAG: hypothetical protein J0653_00955, partial [Deltaproteobacteria bacterium]|nr:hypothetical protein [Deltaproteobacteria bacterium]